MMITAAGTLNAAKVFVVGAGVAGLQAIATARRLGAMVSAYDVRPAVKEQVQSLGGQVRRNAPGQRGRRDQGRLRPADGRGVLPRQRELMTRVVAESDVVITTAAVPGKKSPVLVTAEMVARMAPGSVIVDLAAERGGNCELTQAGQTVVVNGVTILGPPDLPAEVPQHASQLYAKNIATFLLYLVKDGQAHVRHGGRNHPRNAHCPRGRGGPPADQQLLGAVAKRRWDVAQRAGRTCVCHGIAAR